MQKNPQVKKKKYRMDFIEKLTLSPFQKYTRFNRFPWKFLFHLMLVVFTTYQALNIVSIQDKHSRIQQQVFSTIYLGTDDGSSSFPFYSLSDFQTNFQNLFNNTENLNDFLLQYVDLTNVSYEVSVYYSQITKDQSSKLHFQIADVQELIQKVVNINSLIALKEFLNSIQSMMFTIKNFQTYVSEIDNQYDSCLAWTIQIQYNFQSFANVQATLQSKPSQCTGTSRIKTEQNILFISLIVLILALLSLGFSWKQIYQISKQYTKYKNKKHDRSQLNMSNRFVTEIDWKKNWEELGFFDKLKFFDIWFVIGAGGNFFQLIGSIVTILNQTVPFQLEIFQQKQTFIGFGAMFAWITMLKYLEYNQNLNLMTSTLSKAWGNLLMFLIGVLPFFFGFVFLGQCIFWKYTKFQDTSSSVITLFSLSNGDIVNDTFLETWAEGLPGQIYLIIFMILFYTAVQNVFVTIIMQAYEEGIKQKQHKKMLEQKENQQRLKFEKNLVEVSQTEFYKIEEESQNQKLIQTKEQEDPQTAVVISKLKLNSKRIDKVLNEMDKLLDEIEASQLNTNQRQFLMNIYKQNLDNIGRNLKFQINNLGK